MPTYEYLCKDCEHKFEEFQSIIDDPISVCPECKGKPERLISGGAGLLFKGSGFYITDYRNSKYKADAAKDNGSASTTGSSTSSTKSDKSSSDKKKA